MLNASSSPLVQALCVPTPNVSVVALVVQVLNKTFAEEVNAAFKDIAKKELNEPNHFQQSSATSGAVNQRGQRSWLSPVFL